MEPISSWSINAVEPEGWPSQSIIFTRLCFHSIIHTYLPYVKSSTCIDISLVWSGQAPRLRGLRPAMAYVFFFFSQLASWICYFWNAKFEKSSALPWSATYGKVTLPWIFYAVHNGANNTMWIPSEHLKIHAGKSHQIKVASAAQVCLKLNAWFWLETCKRKKSHSTLIMAFCLDTRYILTVHVSV